MSRHPEPPARLDDEVRLVPMTRRQRDKCWRFVMEDLVAAWDAAPVVEPRDTEEA